MLASLTSYLPANCQTYYRRMPADTETVMGQSFAASFIIDLAFNLNVNQALLHGTLSAIATLVCSIVSPYFADVTKHTQLTWAEATFRRTIGTVVAGSIGKLCHYPFMLKNILGYTIINALLVSLDENRRDTRKANLYVY